ncbi:hypothetical protein [Noviherbaspirillum aridicola]|uniref:Uncharacterized protein n=1 Tax=Noviherbaspirillum aridicola TaxID=2849687 RepID=A0ABQ4Q0J9_9BURK|nr:hypothetical protein [Noviherbaspirillum aridicola]GIZ50693.1 hypothetical protein NCCP691_07070 [Noviherbaspirillum aridicola]
MSGSTPANQSPADAAGPHPVRTEKDVISTEDIGLPTGVQPEELPGKLDEIRPEQDKVERKH